VPGEFVVDAHTLPLGDDLPAGSYELWVGLYAPRTGARVAATGPGAEADARVRMTELTLP
jgi:hypothetical protein